jgi:hypothetical protein
MIQLMCPVLEASKKKTRCFSVVESGGKSSRSCVKKEGVGFQECFLFANPPIFSFGCLTNHSPNLALKPQPIEDVVDCPRDGKEEIWR